MSVILLIQKLIKREIYSVNGSWMKKMVLVNITTIESPYLMPGDKAQALGFVRKLKKVIAGEGIPGGMLNRTNRRNRGGNKNIIRGSNRISRRHTKVNGEPMIIRKR